MTERTQMESFRVVCRWLERVDGLEQDLSEKVPAPPITPARTTRHETRESETADEVLAHLVRDEPATNDDVPVAPCDTG